MISTDVWFVSERRRVNGQQQHVVTAREQLGGHGVVAQATAAIHPARSTCEIKNAHARTSDRDGVLERAPPVKMFEEIAFVWLVPTDLNGRQWANVQAIDLRGVHQCVD